MKDFFVFVLFLMFTVLMGFVLYICFIDCQIVLEKLMFLKKANEYLTNENIETVKAILEKALKISNELK